MKNLALALTLIFSILWSCERNLLPVSESQYVYRTDMRSLVKNIAERAHGVDPSFIIIPQNGQDVVLKTYCNDCSSEIDQEYLSQIDAIGREDLNYGYRGDNQQNTATEKQEAGQFLKVYRDAGKAILVTDYCSSPPLVDDSYRTNEEAGYVGFAASSRELDEIPSYPVLPNDENSNNISSIGDAQNFLYLIDPSAFASKSSYLQALAATNYDILIIDAFYNDHLLTKAEVQSLKVKSNGGTRLVIAYMSIGEAEDYRYYWNGGWKTGSPAWLLDENPDWPGNYKVQYWNKDWQQIIYAGSDSYLNKLLTSGFDGAYLDLVDAFEYFEK